MVNSLFAGIFFFSWFLAFITSYFVPNEYIWFPAYYCLLAGLSAGIASNSLPFGLLGFTVVFVMSLSGWMVRYWRIKAKRRLAEMLDQQLDDLRE